MNGGGVPTSKEQGREGNGKREGKGWEGGREGEGRKGRGRTTDALNPPPELKS